MVPVNWVPGRITLNCKRARCWVLTFFWCAVFILIPSCILLYILESGNLGISFPRISYPAGVHFRFCQIGRKNVYASRGCQSPKSCKAFPRKYLHLWCKWLRSLITVSRESWHFLISTCNAGPAFPTVVPDLLTTMALWERISLRSSEQHLFSLLLTDTVKENQK